MTTYRDSMWYLTRLITHEYLCRYYSNINLNILLIGYSIITIDNGNLRLEIIFSYDHLIFIVGNIEHSIIYYSDANYFKLLIETIDKLCCLMV